MRRLLASLFLALLWCLLGGSFSLPNIVLGLAAAWVSLWLVREQRSFDLPAVRLWPLVRLFFLFLRELALSAQRVAFLSLAPRLALRPAIFAFPLSLTRDAEITLLANLITLTPGTLSVDVSPDRRVLYVHALHCPDLAVARQEIADGFERAIREAFPS